MATGPAPIEAPRAEPDATSAGRAHAAGEATGAAGGPTQRRPVRVALFAATAVGVVVALLIVVLATRKAALDRTVSSSLLGKEAPAVEGPTISGERFDLGRQSGWVLVNFFARWCTPCRVEHPELVAFQAEHAPKGDVRLVSVIYADEPAGVRDFFRKNGGDWPVVLDPDGRIALDYTVAKVPESYLIAPDGTVVFKIASGVTRAGLDRLIAQAQAQGRKAGS